MILLNIIVMSSNLVCVCVFTFITVPMYLLDRKVAEYKVRRLKVLCGLSFLRFSNILHNYMGVSVPSLLVESTDSMI